MVCNQSAQTDDDEPHDYEPDDDEPDDYEPDDDEPDDYEPDDYEPDNDQWYADHATTLFMCLNMTAWLSVMLDKGV